VKLIHAYDCENGFDVERYDFNRGLFCTTISVVPDEFGDCFILLDVNISKQITAESQYEILHKLFTGNQLKKLSSIINGDTFGHARKDWHKFDSLIGKKAKQIGYQIIHYTNDDWYGDVYVILNKTAIKNLKPINSEIEIDNGVRKFTSLMKKSNIMNGPTKNESLKSLVSEMMAEDFAHRELARARELARKQFGNNVYDVSIAKEIKSRFITVFSVTMDNHDGEKKLLKKTPLGWETYDKEHGMYGGWVPLDMKKDLSNVDADETEPQVEPEIPKANIAKKWEPDALGTLTMAKK
jgi:hypothetical protein